MWFHKKFLNLSTYLQFPPSLTRSGLEPASGLLHEDLLDERGHRQGEPDRRGDPTGAGGGGGCVRMRIGRRQGRGGARVVTHAANTGNLLLQGEGVILAGEA